MQDPSNAAHLLWRTSETGGLIGALPAPPEIRADGYAIQAAYEAKSAHPRYGWKIAATSAAGQQHINVDGPIAGRLLAEKIADSGATIPLTDNRMLVCEPEFGFRFARDLASGRTYEKSDVMAAVDTMLLTLEIPDSRYTDFTKVGAPSLIADNACARELIVGPAVTADWRSVDLAAHPVRAEVMGAFTREGSGAAVLGDPRDALTWLVGEVTGIGIGVKAGELVTTGTCMIPLEVTPGDEATVDYGPFGTISARFS